jgi:hypothetical protein
MKKAVSAFIAAATIAASLVAVAPAANAGGRGVAAGVVGGLIGGALIGSAIAGAQAAPPPAYYGAPAPVYVEEPPCRVVPQRFWDEYRGVWRVRRVQVCD